ncbi:MAG: DEAD/DEAH box helicase, partial [Planctomycetota bacterium]
MLPPANGPSPDDSDAPRRPQEVPGGLSAPGFLEDPDSSSTPDTSSQGTLFDTDPPPWELAVEEKVAVAGVVFSEAPYGPYDYRIPDSLVESLRPGMRVAVPLARRRRPTTGWCIEVKQNAATSRRLSDVAELLDEEPLCDGPLVRLVLWMSHYYQAPAGQVFDTLIPSSVRAGAGTREKTYLQPSVASEDESVLAALPPKQQRAIRLLIAAGRPMTPQQLMVHAECGSAPIGALRKKGLVDENSRREMTSTQPMRWQLSDGEVAETHNLTGEQSNALSRVVAALDSGKARTLLLHGVTGSGKTEVYIRAIEHVVKFGRAAIVLVPEISLTPQTRGRFERRFQSVAVLHSQMTPAERHHQWSRIRRGEVQVVVGPRSAVFAPLPRLGLIILDEEHDGSFKQDTQ